MAGWYLVGVRGNRSVRESSVKSFEHSRGVATELYKNLAFLGFTVNLSTNVTPMGCVKVT